MPKRAEQEEMDIKGPGVEAVVHKDINRLADKFDDLLEQRATLSESIGDTEKAIMDKMREKGLTVYRYRDQLVTLKPGQDHIKIKTVKADAGSSNGEVEEDGGPN